MIGRKIFSFFVIISYLFRIFAADMKIWQT